MSATPRKQRSRWLAGSRMAACWCASQGRGWPPVTMTSCRCDCAVGAACSAATADPNAPGSGRAGAREVVPPTRILDGFGVFGPPPPNTRPVPVGFTGRGTAENPPGFYGPPEGLLAVNALAPADRLAPLDVSALNARREVYRMSEPQDLRGPVMLAALGLLALDALVVFWLAGG